MSFPEALQQTCTPARRTTLNTVEVGDWDMQGGTKPVEKGDLAGTVNIRTKHACRSGAVLTARGVTAGDDK